MKDLEQMAAALPVNSSAFVVLMEDIETEKVLDGMKGYSANVVTVTVGDELSGVISEYIAGEVTLPPSALPQPTAASAAPAQPAATPPEQPAASPAPAAPESKPAEPTA
jgi:hypothetical protein